MRLESQLQKWYKKQQLSFQIGQPGALVGKQSRAAILFAAELLSKEEISC